MRAEESEDDTEEEKMFIGSCFTVMKDVAEDILFLEEGAEDDEG